MKNIETSSSKLSLGIEYLNLQFMIRTNHDRHFMFKHMHDAKLTPLREPVLEQKAPQRH